MGNALFANSNIAGGLTGTPNISCGTGAFSGNVTLQANLDLQDSDRLRLGSGDDLQIYHDGSNSYISEGGTGVLKISSNRTEILSGSGEICAHFQGDGPVDLYYDNSRKLETKSDGVDITGELQCDSLDVDGAADITGAITCSSTSTSSFSGALFVDRTSGSNTCFVGALNGTTTSSILADGSATFNGNVDLQDNDRLRLGSSDDLQIYHSGSHSFITDSGTGNLYLNSSKVVITNAADTETLANFIENGAVELFYDASKKFETKSDGVDITGELQCDSLDVDGAADITGNVTIADKIIHSGDTNTAIRFPAADTVAVETSGSERLRIASSGQIGLGGANYGTSGQVITSNGSGSAPTWQDAGVTLNDDTSTNSNMFPMFASSSSGTLTTAKVSSSKLTYNPSTGRLTSTSVNSSSDENLKKDITSVGSALDKVKKLRGVDYTWKDTNEKGKGVIAQELQEVFPELVSEEPNGYLSVNYNGLIAVLIEAIKELSDNKY